MSAENPLDRGRIERLSVQLIRAVLTFHRENAATDPGTITLEALNALGHITAIMLHGTGQDPEALRFFQGAVTAQLAQMAIDWPDRLDQRALTMATPPGKPN